MWKVRKARQSWKVATKIRVVGSCVKTGSKCTNQRPGIWTNHSAAAAAAARTLQQVCMTSLIANQRSPQANRPAQTVKGTDAVELITLLSQMSKLTHRHRRHRIYRVHSTRTPHLDRPWREPNRLTRRTTTVLRVPRTHTSVCLWNMRQDQFAIDEP